VALSELDNEIKKRFSKRKKIGIYWHEDQKKKDRKDHHTQLKKKVRTLLPKCIILNVNAELTQSRLRVDNYDLGNLKSAITKSNTAFQQTLTEIRHCKTEADIHATLHYNIHRQSYFQNSFNTIVANGKNACTLHYTKNNAPLNNKSLLLIDFGIRWHGMCSDISRTFPLSGTFNPLQKLLYSIVLSAQKEVEKNAKAGISIDELNNLCWQHLNDLLDKKVRSQGGKIKKDYDINPHNVGHLIAHQVHDGDYYRVYKSSPLQEGNVITNEPGFYGHVTMKIDGKAYSEDIGIRIEDNLLITKDGCENLSKAIPKTITQLEALLT